MKIDNSIIEKIQKLLSLANSPNENEAKAATTMANKLLIKYNLSIQQIESHQNEYVVEDAKAEFGYTLKPHHGNITDLLQEYFFVKILISSKFDGFSSGQYAWKKSARARYKKIVQFVGTRENVKIASYIFQYLDGVYPKLWKEKYDTNAELKPNDRNSYYMGLTRGIATLLREAKWQVQEEMGLVLVEDPALKKHTDEITKGKSYGGESSAEFNRDIFMEGVEDGKNVTLRKPIESQASQDNTKRLIKSK